MAHSKGQSPSWKAEGLPFSQEKCSIRSFIIILYFVDRASRYIYAIGTNLLHYSFAVYFVNQHLHVSGIFVAHHQEVHCMYTTIGPANRQSTRNTTRTNFCIYIYIYSVPPDDVLQICPKHVEADWRNKERINSASSWFSLDSFIIVFTQNRHWISFLVISIRSTCSQSHETYPPI